jgi:archaellum component FlaC
VIPTQKEFEQDRQDNIDRLQRELRWLQRELEAITIEHDKVQEELEHYIYLDYTDALIDYVENHGGEE